MNSNVEQESDPSSMPASAAKSLIENMVNSSDRPEYTENVVKSALGAMYLGTPVLHTSAGVIWQQSSAGSDTVRYNAYRLTLREVSSGIFLDDIADNHYATLLSACNDASPRRISSCAEICRWSLQTATPGIRGLWIIAIYTCYHPGMPQMASSCCAE